MDEARDELWDAIRPFTFVKDGQPRAWDEEGKPEVTRLASDFLEHVLGGAMPDRAVPLLVEGKPVIAAVPAARQYGSLEQRWLVVVRTVFDPVDMHRHQVGTVRFRAAEGGKLLVPGGRWEWDESVTSASGLTHDEALRLLARFLAAGLPAEAGDEDEDAAPMAPDAAWGIVRGALVLKSARVELAMRVLFQAATRAGSNGGDGTLLDGQHRLLKLLEEQPGGAAQ